MAGRSRTHQSISDEINEVSWDFEGQRSRSSFSSTHFHPGRFISQLPSLLISLLSEEHDTILDPYCGSGTTVVEAQRLSRKSIGIDINPISIMITRAKTLGLNTVQVEAVLNQFLSVLTQPTKSGKRNAIPEEVQISKWYGNSVGTDLSKLFWDIECTAGPSEKLLKQYCFSSILLKVCRETRHWGYVCDNTQPKDTPLRNVFSSLKAAVRQTIAGYHEQSKFVDDGISYTPILHQNRAECVSSIVPKNSVDLIVTSPPYFGVVDYVKAQRLSIEWFGHDLDKFRNLETGARSKRHRRKGLEQFTEELALTFCGLNKVLKSGGVCAVVLGASKSRLFKVENLIPIAIQNNFEPVETIERKISKQRRMNPSLDSETLFLFRKP